MSESSVDVDDESSGSDFTASKAKPTKKRQRISTKAVSSNVEPPTTNKPASAFAKKNGKIWQSNMGHLVGSPDWKKEIFARDEVWTEIKKLPKKVLSARLAVKIVTELEPTTTEKPKTQSRNTLVVTNGSVRKPVVAKAAADMIGLSDHDKESEDELQKDPNDGRKADAQVPDSTRQSQQQMLNHWAASRASKTILAPTTEQSNADPPPAPAGLAGRANATEQNTGGDKNVGGVEAGMASPASTEVQPNAERQANDAASDTGEVKKAKGVNKNNMSVDAQKAINAATAGSINRRDESLKQGEWVPTHF